VPLSAVRCTHECIIVSAPETQNKVYSAQLSSYLRHSEYMCCCRYMLVQKSAIGRATSETKDKRCMCALNPKAPCHIAALVTCSNKVNCSAQPNLAKQRGRKKYENVPRLQQAVNRMDGCNSLCAGTSAKSF
jgi:hypothetical protein